MIVLICDKDYINLTDAVLLDFFKVYQGKLIWQSVLFIAFL